MVRNHRLLSLAERVAAEGWLVLGLGDSAGPSIAVSGLRAGLVGDDFRVSRLVPYAATEADQG